ncbi:MAG: RNA polymerase factor sigma-54 [Bacteroidaceae bacterium]
MAQKLVQAQSLTQTQTLAPQQLLLVRLLELPLSDLEERVNNELVDNAALEEGSEKEEGAELEEEGFDDSSEAEYTDPSDEGDFSSEVLADYRTLDDVPDYLLRSAANSHESTEMPIGEHVSFYEQLKQQISECNLTQKQQMLIEYLIGSLDSDGLLRKGLPIIVDELAIYNNIETTEQELGEVLHVLQDFEPRGIGARSLQECLYLQLTSSDYKSRFLDVELRIIDRYFDDFTHKRVDKLQQRLQLTPEEMQQILTELKRLNPRPGNAFDEVADVCSQQVIPDFVVRFNEEGDLLVTLNHGEVPPLHVSRAFRVSMDEYMAHREKLSYEQKSALIYTKQKIDAARTFISIIEQRNATLYATMQAIVDFQRPFFEEGDEALLRPMILKDIAACTGLDISTISRVNNSKYVQTPFGVFPLKYFFNDKFVTKNGEAHSTLKIKSILKDYIDREDKQSPLADEALAALLKEAGYPVARRTVAKYREQMGLPVARLRR